MRISDWSSDVCSSDLNSIYGAVRGGRAKVLRQPSRSRCMSERRHGWPCPPKWPAPISSCAEHKRNWTSPGRTWKSPIAPFALPKAERSEEHTSELQSLMRTSYAVFCFKKHNDL